MSEPADDRYRNAGQQLVLQVLEALAQRPLEGVTLDDLVETVGAGRDAVFRAARNLELAGWAERAPGGGWRPAPRAGFVSDRIRLALADVHTRYFGGIER